MKKQPINISISLQDNRREFRIGETIKGIVFIKANKNIEISEINIFAIKKTFFNIVPWFA